MAKTKSKPAATTPSKKNGDGGRVTKPTTKVEKTKAAAKAVVTAATTAAAAAGQKAKKAIHESTVLSAIVQCLIDRSQARRRRSLRRTLRLRKKTIPVPALTRILALRKNHPRRQWTSTKFTPPLPRQIALMKTYFFIIDFTDP
jgi:nucleolin